MAVIGIINCGGNFGSVWHALSHLGLGPRELRRAEEIDRVDRVILPGVGAFPALRRRLEAGGMIEALQRHAVERAKPFLGICVGMQMLADEGREFETCPGLGWIAGVVDRIAAAGSGLRVPHIGWNRIETEARCPLFKSMPDRPSFYFVHSYALKAAVPTDVAGRALYGEPITACVQRGTVFGVQFHPEKSQRDGLRLLKNFAEVR